MSLRRFLLAGALALLSAAASARAQDSWNTVASPTAQNLWSVAHGNGRFVAAGEGGTILTSPDGLTWTARASGTATWLVGAAYANSQFVVVGDRGTLLTSPDGVAWIARATGTTERLNAVAFGGERWLAVGENGIALTSLDGSTWSLVPRSEFGWTSALSGWLRGLCFAYGSFVATGERGRIVTTADANYFFNRSIATSAHLEGLAYARRRFVAVGDGGLVLTSSDAVAWRGHLAPAPLRAVAFFNNVFVGAGPGGAIVTSPDGTAWTTRPSGSTATLTALAGGPSTLVAVGLGGAILRSSAASAPPVIVTPPADLTEAAGNHVLLTVTATGTAPLAYQWSFDGRLIAGATADTLALRRVSSADAGRYAVTVRNAFGTTTSSAATLAVVASFPAPTEIFDPTFVAARGGNGPVLIQPDGKILLGASDGLCRLNADGSLDPAFSPLLPTSGVTLATLARQPDGKILAGGTSGYLVRLTVAGQPDTTFAAASALAGSTISHVLLQPDGKVLVAHGATRLLRLNADGSLDASFAGADLSPYASEASPAVKLAALAPDGRIVVAAAVATVPNGTNYALVARLRADGTIDPTFTPVHTGVPEPRLLHVQPDGRIVFASDFNPAAFFGGRWLLQRLNADGTDDATFLTQSGGFSKYGGNMRAAVDASGRIVVMVALNNYSPGLKVMRFHSDGTVDQTLSAEEPLGTPFRQLLDAIAVQPDGRALVSRTNGLARLVAANATPQNPLVALTDSAPLPVTVTGGSATTFTTEIAGTNPSSFGWTGYYADRTYVSPYSPTSGALSLFDVRQSGTFYAIASNAAGSLAYPPFTLRVPPQAPAFTGQPADVAANSGRIVEFSFTALGSGPLTWELMRNGEVVRSGTVTTSYADTPTYYAQLPSGLSSLVVGPDTVGTYRLVLRNALGTATSSPFVLSLDSSSRLVDVATRGFVGTGPNVLIAGFAIAGPMPKWVLIRGVGPGLAPFGITDYLADPQLALFDATGARLEENDNWLYNSDTYSAFYYLKTFELPTGSRDAIIARRLAPGTYTAQLSGVGNTTGIALVEVYEGPSDSSRLVNLSSRVRVERGAKAAISGVVVTGTQPKRLLLRAIGPSLALFGVAETIEDPTLTLFDGAGAILATNDNWDLPETGAATRAEIADATARVGAFSLLRGTRDAALLVTVAPGSYTAIVGGAFDTTGVALVEIYEVP